MITQQELQNNDLFRKLDSLDLDPSQYVIMGSGIMFALGIRQLTDLDDIDILVTESGWEKVKSLAEIHHDDEWNCDHLYLFDEKIEIYNGWGPSKYIPENLIAESLKIGRYNFASLEDVIKWKKELGRDKDYKHIAMIMNFLRDNNRKISMKLKTSPFNMIKNGQKTIELRLFDEKRELIHLGDVIEFSELENLDNKIRVKVVGLSRFPSFEELLTHLDPKLCGWEDTTNISDMTEQMRQYYTKEEEQKYGVIGIHIKLVE